MSRAARNKRHSFTDLATQARYIAGLNADFVAWQEVDGPGGAKLLSLSGYSLLRVRVATNGTSGAPAQDIGFAVRDGIPFQCKPAWREIGLPDNSVH